MNWPRTRKVLLALGAFLILIQIFQPRRTNPPVVSSRTLKAHVQVPEHVYELLLRSCGDCHSNETRWPWYSHVAPFSWVITDDVNQGRRHMNFEDWEAQESPKDANDHLKEICNEIQRQGMPPFSYRLTHRELQLRPNEVASLCAWSQAIATSASGLDTGSGLPK